MWLKKSAGALQKHLKLTWIVNRRFLKVLSSPACHVDAVLAMARPTQDDGAMILFPASTSLFSVLAVFSAGSAEHISSTRPDAQALTGGMHDHRSSLDSGDDAGMGPEPSARGSPALARSPHPGDEIQKFERAHTRLQVEQAIQR
jgi:hypothetical protein